MFRRLLVAFDGSTHALRALTEAVDMAQTNSGRLTVMTVVPEPSAWALGSGYAPAVDLNDLSRQIEREYQAMLTPPSTACPATSQSRRSSRAEPRPSLARREPSEAAHHVLQASPVPVLVVHVSDESAS